jgi:hypothetical protein
MVHDLYLVPDVPPESEILEGVEGLAWDHATVYASLVDMELGSDEFLEMHKELMERYSECGASLGYMQHTGMRFIQTLLQTNKIALVVGKNDSPDEVTNTLILLGHVATSALMWIHASYPTQWIPNTLWEHLEDGVRGVDFYVNIPTGGGKDDDDR